MENNDSNSQIINIQKGNTEIKTPISNTEWDIMSSSMRDLVDIFFLEKRHFLEREPLKKLSDYIKTYDRLLYTILSDKIYESFSVVEDKESTILNNIDSLLELCEDDIKKCPISKNNKELRKRKRIKRIIFKIKDHTNLAIRQYRSLKQTDEEYIKKFNEQIGDFKRKLTQELTSQLITLVGIFTAIAFVVFGGISSLGSIFSDLNNKSIIKLIITSSIWGLSMFNLIFGFLLGISKMTGLNLGNSRTKDFFERYILVFWMNGVMITILILTLWLYFIFKINIFEELFFPAYKKFLFLIGTILIGTTICYSFKFLKQKTINIKNI